MKLINIRPKQAKPARKRKGQGNATGNGTFGGRGMNGQNSRSGGGVRLGFEGGQTPLIQRMPKMKGFRNPNRVESQVVNLDQLEIRFKEGETVNFDSLIANKLVSKNNPKVKVLGSGELTKKLNIEGLLVSKSAKGAIEKAGGSIK
jgi:large subunit ribosomal protein L15